MKIDNYNKIITVVSPGSIRKLAILKKTIKGIENNKIFLHQVTRRSAVYLLINTN